MKRTRTEKILGAAFTLMAGLPMVSLLVNAFFSRWGREDLFPRGITADGFAMFLSRDAESALRSFLFSLAVALAVLMISIPAAWGVSRLPGKLRRSAETILYLPMLMPAVSVTMGSEKLFLAVSMTGTGAVFLMHMYFALPYTFALVYACHKAWGLGEEKAAQNLGSGVFRTFFQVHLPRYRNGYLNAFRMGFIISWGQYFVNFYLGGWQDVNFSMILEPYITGSNRNLASAYTVVFLLAGSIVLLACNRIRKRGAGKERNLYG